MTNFLKTYIRLCRHRKLISIFIPDNGAVLDLSCGKGELLERIRKVSPNLSLHGIDMSASDIADAKINCNSANFLVAKAEHTPYPAETFNVVICLMALHHYSSPQQILTEIRRVLSPKGILYIMDIIPKYRWSQKLWNFWGCSEPYHFEKYYLSSEIEEFAAEANLILKKEEGILTLSPVRVLTFFRQ